jgi:MFS family permease
MSTETEPGSDPAPDGPPGTTSNATSVAESDAAAGIWATFRESPLAVKTVLGGVVVNKIGGFLNIFLVLFVTSQGYSAAQAATALGVYGAGFVVGVLAGGALSGRLGARNATVISMLTSAVLTAALLYLPSYPLILCAVALVGAIGQIYRPASAALLADLTPPRRQVMVFAMYRFGLNLGTTLAPLIGFALYNLDHQDYDLLFWGEALIALAYAVLAYVALPGRTAPADEPAEGEPGAATERGGYLAVLRDRRYRLYLLGSLFNGIVYIQYLSTLPLDVRASGVEIFWYTLAVSLNGFIVIAFELPLTKLSQHWPSRLTVGLAYGLIGIGVAFYGLPLGPAVIVSATLIWTIGEIIGAPTVWAYPGMAGPPRLRSHYIGSFQFMYALGAAVGPVIGGVLFVHIGHRVWPVMAVAGLIAAALGAYAVRARTEPEPEPEREAEPERGPRSGPEHVPEDVESPH